MAKAASKTTARKPKAAPAAVAAPQAPAAQVQAPFATQQPAAIHHPGGVDPALLQRIIAATTPEGGFMYAPAELLANMERLELVEVSHDYRDANGHVAVRAAEGASAYLEAAIGDAQAAVQQQAPAWANGAAAQAAPFVAAPQFAAPAPAPIAAPVHTPAPAPALGRNREEVRPGVFVDYDVPMPVKRVRAPREDGIPFDTMRVGGSHHIAPTEEKPDPARSFGSLVSQAKKRYMVQAVDEHGVPLWETVDGEQKPVANYTREFSIVRVDGTDPSGPGARVFRVK